MHVDWFATILIRDLEGCKREIAAFSEEAAVWATPAGITNSSGTLALHLAGNIQHFVGAVLGASGYVRDRDREFAARGVPKAALLAELDAAIAAVRMAMGKDRLVDLDAPYPERVGGKIDVVTGDWLLSLAAHLAFHLGQMGYHRRLVTGDGTSIGPIPPTALATARVATA